MSVLEKVRRKRDEMAPHRAAFETGYRDSLSPEERSSSASRKSRKKGFYTVLSCRGCCVITSVDGPFCGVKPIHNEPYWNTKSNESEIIDPVPKLENHHPRKLEHNDHRGET